MVAETLFKQFWCFNYSSLHFTDSKVVFLQKEQFANSWLDNILIKSKNETFKGFMLSV